MSKTINKKEINDWIYEVNNLMQKLIDKKIKRVLKICLLIKIKIGCLNQVHN